MNQHGHAPHTNTEGITPCVCALSHAASTYVQLSYTRTSRASLASLLMMGSFTCVDQRERRAAATAGSTSAAASGSERSEGKEEQGMNEFGTS